MILSILFQQRYSKEKPDQALCELSGDLGNDIDENRFE
jgi:hypothetical protein